GYTVMLPEEDRHLHTRSDLADRLAMTLGGRTAEEVVLGEITTGAVDDIEKASRLARAMVTEFGMSDKLGPQRFEPRSGEPFLGREQRRSAEYSEELAARIDDEVARLLDEAHARARHIVESHRATLDVLTDALLEHETLVEDDLNTIFAGLESA
ncbi:MAG: cell division protein FtsH, partial [Actinomycetes bacterium]